MRERSTSFKNSNDKSCYSSLFLKVCGGKPMFTCLRNFCEWSSCPAHPDAKCRVNPCGGCKVEFVDKDGKVVNCEKGNIDLYEDYVVTKLLSYLLGLVELTNRLV